MTGMKLKLQIRDVAISGAADGDGNKTVTLNIRQTGGAGTSVITGRKESDANPKIGTNYPGTHTLRDGGGGVVLNTIDTVTVKLPEEEAESFAGLVSAKIKTLNVATIGEKVGTGNKGADPVIDLNGLNYDHDVAANVFDDIDALGDLTTTATTLALGPSAFKTATTEAILGLDDTNFVADATKEIVTTWSYSGLKDASKK